LMLHRIGGRPAGLLTLCHVVAMSKHLIVRFPLSGKLKAGPPQLALAKPEV
jgi:hypothetical protein